MSSSSCTISCVDPVLLRRALRLVHCLQKERGASCAFYASRHEQNIVENMERARVDSDRAIQMMLSGRGEFKVHATLVKIRQMVQVDLLPTEKRGSCHRILVCFNALISSIVHDYFMEKIALQEKTLQIRQRVSREHKQKASPLQFRKKSASKKSHHRASSLGDCLLFSEAPLNAPHPRNNNSKTLVGSVPNRVDSSQRFMNVPMSSPPETLGAPPPTSASSSAGGGGPPRHRRSGSENSPYKTIQSDVNNPTHAEEVLAGLLNLLACFVKLKESTGVERAVLSSLVVAGQEDSLLMSDLVLEVENQRRLLDELKHLPSGHLSNLVQELVEMSLPLRQLQQKILTNFDLQGVIIRDPEHHVTAVWDLITVYIDKLHSLELLIIEEIEYSLPSIESSHSHQRDHAKQSLLESEFILGLFGAVASEYEIKSRLENMPAEDIKEKLLQGFTPGSNASSHNNSATANGSDAKHDNSLAAALGDVPDDPLLLIPNLPASKEWEINLYELKFLKRIGKGAAGTTYLAKWTGLEVAVKVASITETGLDGWRTEVQALQKLHHPNIIRLLGSVYHQNPLTFCLVLEYCNAGDLQTAMRLPTAPGFFFHVAMSMAKGVAYLHSRGVMHRDIKPDNILCDGNVKSGNFQIKLTDFGVATDTSILGDRTAETGTYRWMSPEVLRHESYSNMADVYSYAIVLWQLLTREDPYADVSQIEAAGKVALEHARPPLPGATPKAISHVIETCWSEGPDDRWAFEVICDKLPEAEVSLSLSDRKWLDAPLGHPIYFPRKESEHGSHRKSPPPLHKKKEEKVKEEKKKGGFFKIKMFGH